MNSRYPGSSPPNPDSAIKGDASAYEEFWALRDVSFRVKKGETPGIIGKNGSGKSTIISLIMIQ